MTRLRLIVLLICLAAGAAAQDYFDYGGTMGIYFSPTEFTDAYTNLETPPPVFDLYIVLLDAQVDPLGGYECGFQATDPQVFWLTATGPSGWLNFGSTNNHIAGYQNPLPAPPGGVVLSTVTALYVLSDPVDIFMGPSDPSSGDPNNNPFGLSWDGPIIGGYENPDILLVCHLTSGAAGYPDVVATLNTIPVAVEEESWTQIRDLFD